MACSLASGKTRIEVGNLDSGEMHEHMALQIDHRTCDEYKGTAKPQEEKKAQGVADALNEKKATAAQKNQMIESLSNKIYNQVGQA